MDDDMIYLEPDELEPYPGVNPRKRFDPDEIQELAESFKENGVLQNVVAHETGEPVKWLVAGEKRWRAAKIAGIALPVRLREFTRADALRIALAENLNRGDLTPIEEAEGFQQLLDEDEELTQGELGQQMGGKSQSYVANRLRLLQLPEAVRGLVEDGIVAPSYARDLLLPWTKEEEADRFFTVLVQHVRFHTDVGEPVSRHWLEQVVERIGGVVKPDPEPAPEPAKTTATRTTTRRSTPAPKKKADEAPAAAAEVPSSDPESEAAPAPAASDAQPAPEDAAPAEASPEADDGAPPDPEPLPEAPSDAGPLGSLVPVLEVYEVALRVAPYGDDQVSVAIAPRHRKGGTPVTPTVVKAPADRIDARVAEALEGVVAQLGETVRAA